MAPAITRNRLPALGVTDPLRPAPYVANRPLHQRGCRRLWHRLRTNVCYNQPSHGHREQGRHVGKVYSFRPPCLTPYLKSVSIHWL